MLAVLSLLATIRRPRSKVGCCAAQPIILWHFPVAVMRSATPAAKAVNIITSFNFDVESYIDNMMPTPSFFRIRGGFLI